MIVYNVGRGFFELKSDAETQRKAEGLKPGATIKIEIKDRSQLAALLNGLCALEPERAQAAIGNAGTLDVFGPNEPPLVPADADIPKFLRDSYSKHPMPEKDAA